MPTKKAMQFVRLVIDIAAPEYDIALANLFFTLVFIEIESPVAVITNMSSTPMPNTKNGRILCIPATLKPKREANPLPATKARPDEMTPIRARLVLQPLGEHKPTVNRQ